MSRTWICDIETNGLIDPDKLWCVVFINIDTEEVKVFDTQNSLYNIMPYWVKDNVDTFIGHNFMGFDRPILNDMVEGVDIKPEQVVDTLILSRLFNPIVNKRDKKTFRRYKALKRSTHSLSSWGKYLDFPKTPFSSFEYFSREMVDYCIQDCRVNLKVYKELLKEDKDYSKDAIYTEHQSQWVLSRQQKHGFLLDMGKVQTLLDTIQPESDSLRKEMEENVCTMYKPDRVKEIRRNKLGVIYASDLKLLKKSKYKEIEKDKVLLFKEIPFNIASRTQVAVHMERAGWKPYILTKSGNPSVCEENLATLPDTAPEIYKKYARWQMLTSRLNAINEWLGAKDKNNRIRGSVSTIGAKTHRMSHSNPQTANIVGVQSEFGKEFRQSWTVPKGSKLLGTDASGVQLRMLAHYINDRAYTEGILGDPHTMHQEILGLPTRALAKTFIYAWIFQAGNSKLGHILGGTAKDGADAVKMFEDRVKGMARLKVEAIAASKKGYIVGVDGRRIGVASAREVMPAWLQGGEAVLMKNALRLWYNVAIKKGYPMEVVGNIHDEWQTECKEELVQCKEQVTFKGDNPKEVEKLAEAYGFGDNRIWSKPKLIVDNTYEFLYSPLGELQVKSIREAGKRLNLNCPMDGEYIIGDNWYDTH